MKIIFILLSQLLQTNAWWDAGHMLTAAVAYRTLNPAQITEANHLLTNLPGYTSFSSTFISASHWADDIKRNHDAYAFNSWHFIDFPFPNPASCSINTVDEQNLVTALEDMRMNLQNSSLPGWTRAFALRFTIHMMGDAHQPLHTVSRCTTKHPKGDAGGNLFKLNSSEYTNLHKLWDSMGGQYSKTIAALCPYSNIKLCKANEKKRVEAVIEEADRLILEYPADSFGTQLIQDRKVWNENVLMEWAKSSYNIVQEGKVYGDIEEGSIPSSEYLAYVQKTTRERVALGGYRLAQLLNANLVTSDGSNGDGSTNGGLVFGIVLLTLICVGLIGSVVLLLMKIKRMGTNDSTSSSPPFNAL